MQKTIITLLLSCALSTTVAAEDMNQPIDSTSNSKLYVGLDLFNGSTDLERDSDILGPYDENHDQNGFRLKLGVRSNQDLRFEAYFKSEDVDTDFVFFDEVFDSKVYGIGVNAIKAFEVDPQFQPFVLVGIGYDITDIGTEGLGLTLSEDSILGVGFKLGAGALFKATSSIELLVGFDWQYRSWQDIELTDGFTTTTIETKDTSKTVYAGINFLF